MFKLNGEKTCQGISGKRTAFGSGSKTRRRLICDEHAHSTQLTRTVHDLGNSFYNCMGRDHLPLSDKKQAGLVQLSESSGIRLTKTRKTARLQRSKTLDISSRNGKPWKGVA